MWHYLIGILILIGIGVGLGAAGVYKSHGKLWGTSSAFTDGDMVYWFYRPGCPHCDNMKDEWAKMKKSLPSKYNVVDVNTSLAKNQKLAKQYNVQGVPHIVKVNSAGQSVYKGQRTASAMKQWVMK
jgi:thioredoxin-like negative regulator of GroEL